MCALSALLFSACYTALTQSNGYVISSRTPFAAAAPQVALDAADPPISKLKSGFTICTWLRPDSEHPIRGAAPVHFAHAFDTNMLQVFSVGRAGFLFGTTAPTTIKAKDNYMHAWTHVALTHDTASSNVHVYVDGVQQPGPIQIHGSIPIDTQAVRLQMFLGSCTPHDYEVVGTPSVPFQCMAYGEMFAGDVDDFALFNRVLTADDVAARWNASLTDRIAAGLEP